MCDGLGGPPGRTADVDEADQRRDLDERTHYRGKGLARADTEGRDGHRDGELEIVASGRERERGSLFVVEAEATARPNQASALKIGSSATTPPLQLVAGEG